VTLQELVENDAQGKFNELAEKDDGIYQRVEVSTAGWNEVFDHLLSKEFCSADVQGVIKVMKSVVGTSYFRGERQ
jgi:hypothetical protein